MIGIWFDFWSFLAQAKTEHYFLSICSSFGVLSHHVRHPSSVKYFTVSPPLFTVCRLLPLLRSASAGRLVRHVVYVCTMLNTLTERTCVTSERVILSL